MCRFSVDNYTYDSPHTKAFLLLQAHFSRLPLPCVDYITDLKSVLDQAIRIIQVCVIILYILYICNCCDTIISQYYNPQLLSGNDR